MKDVVGIDIGVGSIKIVSVSKIGEQLFLDVLGETKNPAPGWIKDGIKSKSYTQVANAIKMLMSELKIRPKQAVTCLPEDEVISD
jgi:Tfp pilus assembly PilM family ATPase